MSQEFLKKIFVPFERQANSTISGIQGTRICFLSTGAFCRKKTSSCGRQQYEP